jgi:hypothetical protein
MACAEECEKIIGALLVASASSIVGTDTCDKSTIMPSLFISATTSCNWKRERESAIEIKLSVRSNSPCRSDLDHRCAALGLARRLYSNLNWREEEERERRSEKEVNNEMTLELFAPLSLHCFN